MSDQHHTTGSADTEHDQHVVESLGYEARDIVGNRRSIFYFAVFHFGGLLFFGFLVYIIYLIIASSAPTFDGDPIQGDQIASEAAKLQADPGPDMGAYLDKATQRLNGYGWADESTGTAHIPIDKAIEQTVEMNLPHRPEGGQ